MPDIKLDDFNDVKGLVDESIKLSDFGNTQEAFLTIAQAKILLESKKPDHYSELIHRSAINRSVGLITLRSCALEGSIDFEAVEIPLLNAISDSESLRDAVEIAEGLDEIAEFVYCEETIDRIRTEHGLNISSLGRLSLFKHVTLDEPGNLHQAIDKFIEAKDIFDEEDDSPGATINNIFLAMALKLDPKYIDTPGIDPYNLWNEVISGLQLDPSRKRAIKEMFRFSRMLISKKAVIRTLKTSP